MAIRRWAARPDDVIELQDPETGERFSLPIISRDQMREAYLDGEAMQAHAGGLFTAYVERVRTGVPHEMVTVAAVFEWKDRADARPQPEDGQQRQAAPAPIPPIPTPAPPAVADPELAAVAAEAAAQLQHQDAPAASPRSPADEDEEDLSSIPPHLQEVV